MTTYFINDLEQGPFKSWQMDYPPFEWKTIEFSQDGNLLLLLTTNGLIFIVDAFSGNLIQEIKPQTHPSDHIINLSFTPNAQFVFGGSDTGSVYVWYASGGKELGVWDVHDGKPVTGLKWNPKLMMMATGDTNLSLWLPQKEL